MAKVDLFEFSDLLFCAEKNGYTWNQANDILVKDEIPPMYEAKQIEHYKFESILAYNTSGYNYSKDTCKILQAFFKQEGIEKFTLTS